MVLKISDQHERTLELTTDHVIAGTGYQFNVENLPFISQKVKQLILHEQQSPRLSSNFEIVCPRIVFYQSRQCQSFGPAIRFLAGADFTARRIASHLARSNRIPDVHLHHLRSAKNFENET